MDERGYPRALQNTDYSPWLINPQRWIVRPSNTRGQHARSGKKDRSEYQKSPQGEEYLSGRSCASLWPGSKLYGAD